MRLLPEVVQYGKRTPQDIQSTAVVEVITRVNWTLECDARRRVGHVGVGIHRSWDPIRVNVCGDPVFARMGNILKLVITQPKSQTLSCSYCCSIEPGGLRYLQATRNSL